MIKRLYYVKIAICLLIILLCRQDTTLFSQNLPLLPSPQQVVEREGFFNMNEFVPVFQRKNAPLEEQRAIWMLCEGFENIFGKPLKITDKAKGSIIVLRNLSLETPPKKEEKMILPVGEEGYQLNILPDKIEIIANSNAGLFYGSQTLLQLFRTSSLTGNINCMTINDMPSSSQRYLCYYWDSDRAPSFNYIKQLILCASHFKFNGIALLNDASDAPFAEMELFFLRKFAEAYHVDIVTDAEGFSREQIKNNNNAMFFMDNWYSIFWSAELSWNELKNNTLTLTQQRQVQYEKALDRQLFEVDFSLCEQLKSFDSLRIISLTEEDFWRSVHTDGVSVVHSPADNRFVLTRALALEDRWQLLLESTPIMHDEILYYMIFAAQRAGFIALKNLLQESLSQQSSEQKTVQETVKILLENIRHLQKAHETLWNIETDAGFPAAITQQYEQMIFELQSLEL